ncbi:MAG: GAF domain-containing protein [Anaerolineae bacterium]
MDDRTVDQDRVHLLYEISTALSADLDPQAILTTVVSLVSRLDNTLCEIHLLTDQGEIYFESSNSTRNNLPAADRQVVVRQTLLTGVAAWSLKNQQPLLISDTETDPRWSSTMGNGQPITLRSCVCVPIIIEPRQVHGVLLVAHPKPNYFDEAYLHLLQALAAQVSTALKNTFRLRDIQHNLQETHLMLDISRQLSAAVQLKDIYTVLTQGILATGVDRCVIHICIDYESDFLPIRTEVVAAGDVSLTRRNKGVGETVYLLDYPILNELLHTHESLILDDIANDERLSLAELEILQQFEARSLAVIPLISRIQIIGLVFIEYRTGHSFNERELALYRTLCNQATTAIENARQTLRTQAALAETQTLYRAGRVLASAADLQEILQEALIQYVYSLGLDQGGVTLLTPDRASGQLMAYVEHSQLQDVEQLKFPIDKGLAYQQILLSGQPFVSIDAPHDPRLQGFFNFNQAAPAKSLLEAPMVIRGETIGWIGADSVNEYRQFTQQEVDLARAMADQIAVTIQNRRLLEQTERRANRLKAVATVGQSVSKMLDLRELFNTTVDLIRDSFGFYHVSIFLLDEVREWAVVHASTGEVGQIMVQRPHRLQVGGNSIVGFVAGQAQPRIALNVGEDAVHFKNPLLPDTRAEMALPLLSRGVVMGALDVQSVEVNAFSSEDIDTLQIMADQLATAIENARLFEQTERRLVEQATLYRIGTKINSTLKLQEATENLVAETAAALDVSECVLTLLEDEHSAYVINDYVAPNSPFISQQGLRFDPTDAVDVHAIISTQQEFIAHIGNPDVRGMAFDYLKNHQGTALAIVPVLFQGQVIGLLEVYDHTPGRRFTAADVALLNSIALQAANVIQNARLFQAVQDSQVFLQTIVDNIPSMLFVKETEKLRFVQWNKSSEEIFGLTKAETLGKNDYDFFPKDEADFFTHKDREVLSTGQLLDIPEEPIHTKKGAYILHTRKIPVFDAEGRPKYLLGISEDITQRKQAEATLQATFAKTQSLYRLSNILATAFDQKITAELVLGEYLNLLNLQKGVLTLTDKARHTSKVEALYIDGQPFQHDFALAVESDPLIQHLMQQPVPLIIEDVHTHPLTKNNEGIRGFTEVMLFTPLVIQDRVAGVIIAASDHKGYTFSESDIETSEVIARQFSIWLENSQLLIETQHRSNLLQTAAEISRAASSILEVNQLIHTSVNLIRDKFDFYYVGLFLVDEAKEWANLQAGTGEAGRLQLEAGHKLRIGGESMIGWCIQHRQARIALDVGQEAVHFRNPYLPDTHSEMALPLISRDEVMGALTVQSTQPSAFSAEDITLLQTMADHLANAISNAYLFAQRQSVLTETENLYRVTQELLSAHDADTVYHSAIKAVSQTGVDSAAIYMYLENQDPNINLQIIELKVVWSASGEPALPRGHRFNPADLIIEQAIPHHGPLIIENSNSNDPRLTEQLRRQLALLNITSLAAIPLSSHQRRLGFLLVTCKSSDKIVTSSQARFYSAIAQQMVVALENLRLLDISQRRARREEIIREITGKIRSATTVDDILKTTAVELSQILGASRGSINLLTAAPQNQPQFGPLDDEIVGSR